MKRPALLCIIVLAVLGAAQAEVEFLGLDLGKDDRLLFSARADLPGDGSYDSLFAAELATGAITQLTLFPEHIALVDGGRRLEIQNRFGLFRTDDALRNPAPVPGYPSFSKGAGMPSGRILPSAPSVDGVWVLSAERSSAAYSRLYIVNVASGARTLVSEKVESDVDRFPARWSPDSRYFVYAKGGSVYYYSIDQLTGARVLGEDLRKIGGGTIASVRWGTDSSLFYLRGTSLYRILPAEFFPQALYRGLAGMGLLAGITPFPYDPNFDDFWVSTEGSRIVLSKGGRNLFLLYLDPDDTRGPAKVVALPYLLLQGGTTVRDVLWPARGSVTVFTDSLAGAARHPGAYRFSAPSDPTDLDLAMGVQELDAADATELVLSPDGTKILLVSPAGVKVRNYADWKLEAEIKAPDALHALWIGQDRLVIATTRLIEDVSLATGGRSLISLAQAEAFGRSEDGAFMAASSQGAWKIAIPKADASYGAGAWAAADAFKVLPAATNSGAYRVYLETTSAAPGPFRNLVMVRSVKAFGTSPLLPAPTLAYAPFPEKDEARQADAFDHGSRIRRRELALTFDAMDQAEGLVPVLNALKDYGITATFFVNGEFVRRNPGQARLLAASGNEVGSMFYTTVDPTDARFAADRDYIRRGLAKAEDEWFAATGRELALIWHTPFYTRNDDILAAGASMNYRYVGRDMDSLDWVSSTDALRLSASYLDAHTIIERIVGSAKPGSIVPIRLGTPEGGRADYLFLYLPLLVNALEDSGYDIVPVSTLIEHAK
jgi:peptidoglycan/xylan/chitin deacetylase (PgdA/CDA1 family)